MNVKGIAYCVGVGPGDPEYMTLKAIRLIRENDVIAVPGKVAEDAVAYKIAAAVVPEIKDKELVPIYMPMVKDRELIDQEHRRQAKRMESYLDQGKNVVYITLGDSTVYCTFSYLQHYLEADGYTVKLVSGIPSFCAAAAALNTPLTEWDEALHILPGIHDLENDMALKGNYVIMKSASRMDRVKEMIRRSGRTAVMAENCSMANEKLYRSVDEIPDDAGYFSLIIAKE
jgi:precorrin-2/cobalt-factor-2 C20-methyltransferase